MNPCKICGKPIKRRIQINGKPVILTSKRTSCHKCKPYKAGDLGNSRDTTRIKIDRGQTLRLCKQCNKWLENDYYYRHTGFICRTCVLRDRQSKTSIRAKLKQLAVQYKGSKCRDCKRTFSICAYDFHHRDPQQKDFVISSKSCAWNKTIQHELDKCDLLCSNCHRIRHAKHPDYLARP